MFAAAGREVTVEEIPLETLKRELVRAGVPPWNAEGLSELFELYAERRAPRWSPPASRTRSTRDPRTIDEFAKDHAEAFKEAKP